MDLKFYNSIPYLLVKDIGVVLLESSTSATEEMLETQAKCFLRVPLGEVVQTLSDEQCSELENWEAETYRKALEKLASKI